MQIEQRRLRDFIVDAGLVTEEQFIKSQKKAEKDGKTIENILVSEGMVNQEELTKLEAYIIGIPFVNLEKEVISPEILSIIPEPIAKKNNIVAFRKKGMELEVAMLDPEDLATIEFIKKKSNFKICFESQF